ncbi:MAG: DUF1573 domain-containing protein [Planctomycetes bacterium]|nr:DUF1573 domain-containing protein [Planctomycetota bacterium]
MFSTHPRTHRHLRLALFGVALTGATFLSACTGESKPTTTTSSTSTSAKPEAVQQAEAAANKIQEAANKAASQGQETSNKAAAAAQETAKKVEGAAADVAKKTEAVAKDAGQAVDAAAKEAAAKAAQAAQQAANEKAKLASQAAADEHAGHDHAKTPDAPKAPYDPNNPESVDPNSKAKLTFEFGTDTKNFGKVLQGDVLNHVFQLVSSGEEDLVIRQAKPTCGCTVAQITCEQPDGTFAPYAFGNPIAVGRKIQIKATLHTVNKRGHAGSRINIFSNDPRGQSQLGLEADVDPFFNINPAVINFNTLSAKDTAADKASITTAHGERVKLNAALDNVPQGLKVELKPLDADADGKASRWDLAVTAGPGLVEGSLAYMVPLKSDLAIPGGEKLPNGQAPTYESSITVMARVTGMIEFAPAFVSLGLIRPGQTQSRSIRLTSHDNEFKVNEPKVAIQGRDTVEWEYAKYFSTTLRPVPNENAIDVEVTLNGMPESLSGSFSGNLVIQTGYAAKPEIKLPITGVCRGGAVAPASGVSQPAGTQPK